MQSVVESNESYGWTEPIVDWINRVSHPQFENTTSWRVAAEKMQFNQVAPF